MPCLAPSPPLALSPPPPSFLLSFLFGIASPKVHFERNRFPSSRRCNLVFHFEDMMVKEKFRDLITVEGKAWEIKESTAPSQGDGQQASLAITAEHRYDRQLPPCDTNRHAVHSYSCKYTHTTHVYPRSHTTTHNYMHMYAHSCSYNHTCTHDIHTYAYTYAYIPMYSHDDKRVTHVPTCACTYMQPMYSHNHNTHLHSYSCIQTHIGKYYT